MFDFIHNALPFRPLSVYSVTKTMSKPTKDIEFFSVTDHSTSEPNFLNQIKRRKSIKLEANVNGFNAICLFHQIFGLPYYDMKPQFNIFRTIFGFVYSLSFITIFVGKS